MASDMTDMADQAGAQRSPSPTVSSGSETTAMPTRSAAPAPNWSAVDRWYATRSSSLSTSTRVKTGSNTVPSTHDRRSRMMLGSTNAM